jgi:predicted kinase
MAKLIIVVGLPGAGKSYYLDNHTEVRSLARDHVVHDFHSGAIGDLSAPEMSQHFQRLVLALHHGEDCAIADVALCRGDR